MRGSALFLLLALSASVASTRQRSLADVEEDSRRLSQKHRASMRHIASYLSSNKGSIRPQAWDAASQVILLLQELEHEEKEGGAAGMEHIVKSARAKSDGFRQLGPREQTLSGQNRRKASEPMRLQEKAPPPEIPAMPDVNSIVMDQAKEMIDSGKQDRADQMASGAIPEELGVVKAKLDAGMIAPEEFEQSAFAILKKKTGDGSFSCEAQHSTCKITSKEYLGICVKASQLALKQSGTVKFARRANLQIRETMEQAYRDTPYDAATGPTGPDDSPVVAETTVPEKTKEESPLDPSKVASVQESMMKDAVANMNAATESQPSTSATEESAGDTSGPTEE